VVFWLIWFNIILFRSEAQNVLAYLRNNFELPFWWFCIAITAFLFVIQNADGLWWPSLILLLINDHGLLLVFDIVPMPSGGRLRFGGGPVQNIWGAPFLCGARKNLPAPSVQKCCDSDMFCVHQHTNCTSV